MFGFAPAQGLASSSLTSAAFPLLAPNGTAAAPSYAFSSTGNSDNGIYLSNDNVVSISCAGAEAARFQPDFFTLLSDSQVIRMGAGADVILARDAAAVLALKNGATAQTFRVYGTTTGTKYLSLSHNGTDALIDTASSSGQITIGGTNATGVRVGGTGLNVGFYGTTPIALQTGVAVSAAGVHAALVALGLITA